MCGLEVSFLSVELPRRIAPRNDCGKRRSERQYIIGISAALTHKGHNVTDTYSKSIMIIHKNLLKINNNFESFIRQNRFLIRIWKQSCKNYTIFSLLICKIKQPFVQYC